MDLYTTIGEEKEYAAFKAQQHYRKIEHVNNISLQFITEMILCNKLEIQDLPFELRTSYRTFYLSAFRTSSQISPQRFIDDIMLLYNDLKNDFADKRYFTEMLLSTLKYYDIKGDKKFEDTKKNITEEVLSGLHDS